MLIRQHEREVEELDVHLGFEEPIISSGAVMTLPAATADLMDWVADRRKYLKVQCDDWMQVIGDYRDSLTQSGPKLRKLVEGITAPLESLLQSLWSPTVEADGTTSYTPHAAVRPDILQQIQRLDAELATEPALIAAWRDLVCSVKSEKRSVEEISFRRDTLYALAQRRNLDVSKYGIFRDVCAVLTDVADSVQAELDEAAGVEHEPSFPPNWEPSGLPTWRRLHLCEQVLAREPYRRDCIVWLRLAPTSLPQWEVSHGQVAFYNASVLSGFIGHPELAHRFKVPPMEVLSPPEFPPVVPKGEVEWEDNWQMVYARVVLPGIEVHAAERKARALVEGLKAVNHATKDTWKLLNGSILFIDGRRHSHFSWGPKENIPEPFYAQNDWMGREIARMSHNNRSLNAQSMQDLQDGIGMSTTLKIASEESPQATVMAAVRAIEHVNAWTTGGVSDWTDFARDYFKKAQSRVRVVEHISHYARAAIDHVPDRRPSAPAQQELFEIRTKLEQLSWPHQVFHVRGAADDVPALRRIYADHWLARGLGELETALATPEGMYARLEEQGRRFDRHLSRLKRLRNSAIHGGPVSDTGCQSVEVFSYNLGHQCLNEAMRALLTGRDMATHMADYRADHIDRYDRACVNGDIDALFVEADIDPEDKKE